MLSTSNLPTATSSMHPSATILRKSLTSAPALGYGPLRVSVRPHDVVTLSKYSPEAHIVADRYPSAQVIGIDLSPIQPSWAPINVRFMIDDVEDDWVESDVYNLIHMRHSCPYLSNIEGFLQKCYDHLVPGGWCEFSDFGGRALCDDGTMPDDYPVNEAMALWHTIMAQTGGNTLIVNEHENNFKSAGFTGVRCRIIKTPIGAWPKACPDPLR